MHFTPKHRLTSVLLLLFGTSVALSAQVVRTQVSDWTEVLDANSLITTGEAGSDLNPVLETVSNYNQMDVRNVKNTQNWKVSVSKQDVNWPGVFVPYVQRTSTGNSCGGCAGVNTATSPSGYVQITDLEQDFIFGSGKVNDIDLQFRIEGITLALKADYYRTNIVFTLYGE